MNDFNYLGCTFNFTGSFILNNQTLYGKGLKAMNVLIANLKRHDVLPKIALQLFDAFGTPVLYYGCEVSGFTNANNIEQEGHDGPVSLHWLIREIPSYQTLQYVVIG